VLSCVVSLFDLSCSSIVIFSIAVPIVMHRGCFFGLGLRNLMGIFSTLLSSYV
jgi:hypothetical protein